MKFLFVDFQQLNTKIIIMNSKIDSSRYSPKKKEKKTTTD